LLVPQLKGGAESRSNWAFRDGDRQIDTAHLLHSLIESDPEACAALGAGPQVARVLGYLVQRSIGYGLRWQGSVEYSGTIPVVRETDAEISGWSPSAAAAMQGALERAHMRGDERAGGTDLLACLAADPECRAVEVLERAGGGHGAAGWAAGGRIVSG
jgi:hypothetical protein